MGSTTRIFDERVGLALVSRAETPASADWSRFRTRHSIFDSAGDPFDSSAYRNPRKPSISLPNVSKRAVRDTCIWKPDLFFYTGRFGLLCSCLLCSWGWDWPAWPILISFTSARAWALATNPCILTMYGYSLVGIDYKVINFQSLLMCLKSILTFWVDLLRVFNASEFVCGGLLPIGEYINIVVFDL